jgi:hypothetical protein
MFCDKCNMLLAICICNILPLVAVGDDKAVEVSVKLADGSTATFRPGVEQPTITKAEK